MTTKVKEKPILFSGPMVRAILEGRKTQTRRVVKPQPHPLVDSFLDLGDGNWKPCWANAHDLPTEEIEANNHCIRCPYQPGMRLWVKETWGAGWDCGNGCYSALQPTGTQHAKPDKIFYKADGWDESDGRYCWRPSIFMPRWASRITLEVTAVRVERLQDIGMAEIIAEGVHVIHCSKSKAYRDRFAQLWDSINAKSHPWASNPWVWVVEFRRVQ